MFNAFNLPIPEGFETSGRMEQLKIQTRLNESIGFDEMVGHLYVDGDPNRERCDYASGVSVEVDREAKTFRIAGHPGFDGKVTTSPERTG